MSSRIRAVLLVGVGLGMGLLVGVGMMVGALVVGGHSGDGASRPFISLPETALHATSTDSGDTFSIATGPIDEDVEGLFTLDFLTGNLQCLVVNPRSGGWSIFRYNVQGDLGTKPGKAAKLLMVTGAWATRGGASGRPADSVVYVADAVSGHVAVYTVPWDRTLPATGRSQEGVLLLLAVGKARDLAVRE